MGKWTTTDELNQRASVCVLNIPPHDNCFNCYDKAFCRFTNKSRQETECVCPTDREGEFCEILKNGKIRLNKIRAEGAYLVGKRLWKTSNHVFGFSYVSGFDRVKIDHSKLKKSRLKIEPKHMNWRLSRLSWHPRISNYVNSRGQMAFWIPFRSRSRNILRKLKW